MLGEFGHDLPAAPYVKSFDRESIFAMRAVQQLSLMLSCAVCSLMLDLHRLVHYLRTATVALTLKTRDYLFVLGTNLPFNGYAGTFLKR